MSNYPYIPATITPPWLFEDDQEIDNYNDKPLTLSINNKLFELVIDVESRGHIYLDNYSGDGDDINTMIFDQVTVAAESLDLQLDGFDGEQFTAHVIMGDDEDKACAVEMLKSDLYSNGGIIMEEV